MPEYLAPGVYIEETSYRSKTIEGVSTTTTGFVGPTRSGPVSAQPEVITSLAEFERTYGDGQMLEFTASDGSVSKMDNFMWQAARAFFEEGGQRLYIARAFQPASSSKNGHASGTLKKTGGDEKDTIELQAGSPGKLGNTRVQFTLKRGQNILGQKSMVGAGGQTTMTPALGALTDNDLVLFYGDKDATPTPYLAKYDPAAKSWTLCDAAGTVQKQQSALIPGTNEVRVATVALTIESGDKSSLPITIDKIPLDPQHTTGGAADSLKALLMVEPESQSQRVLPIEIKQDDKGKDLWGSNLTSGIAVYELLTSVDATSSTPAASLPAEVLAQLLISLGNGDDGQQPAAGYYTGDLPDPQIKSGLKLFEDLDDISIIAAPGATYNYEKDTNAKNNADTVINALIAHAEKMKYRVAVLDAGDGQTLSQIQNLRAKLDSTYAALYYPWIQILDPITQKEISVPPSGALAGIYARNDTTRAVYKAPANEVVRTAIGFESTINRAQQEVLNPEGINCLRFFENRGYRVWGARTISSDPEWKYVNVRRYLCYLEHSIERGTQWAVFEPNGEALWENVRSTISDFLFNEFKMGALLGETPVQAFFVRCDRSTMTQNDIDNGRLVCLIGVAVLRPAEFVIFRIGQWTADSQS